MNVFLDTTIKSIRSVFNGKITYASGTWEKVDWNIFDIISINHYLVVVLMGFQRNVGPNKRKSPEDIGKDYLNVCF